MNLHHLHVIFLILLLQSRFSTENANKRLRRMHIQLTNSRQTRASLRINYKSDSKQENYNHVSEDLKNFLGCLENAPNHIPPITIGEYKKKVVECLSLYKADKIVNDSKDALKEDLPKGSKPLFRCLAGIKLIGENPNRQAAQVLPCLEKGDTLDIFRKLGGELHEDKHKTTLSPFDVTEKEKEEDTPPQTDEEQKKKELEKEKPQSSDEHKETTTPSNVEQEETTNEQFALTLHECVTKSELEDYEKKVSQCMNLFKEDEKAFFTKFNPNKPQHTHTEFAAALKNCILKSKSQDYDDKVQECMNLYKENEENFYSNRFRTRNRWKKHIARYFNPTTAHPKRTGFDFSTLYLL